MVVNLSLKDIARIEAGGRAIKKIWNGFGSEIIVEIRLAKTAKVTKAEQAHFKALMKNAKKTHAHLQKVVDFLKEIEYMKTCSPIDLEITEETIQTNTPEGRKTRWKKENKMIKEADRIERLINEIEYGRGKA